MLVNFSNHIPHLVVGTLLLPDRESAKIHSNQANPIIRGPNQSLTSPTGMHNSLPLLNPNYSIANVHPSGDLDIPDHLRLSHLPPYSPERNPTKIVFEYLKSNRVVQVVQDVCIGVKIAWHEFEDNPDPIKSITSRK